MDITIYNHHGVNVKVRGDLKGKHRKYCLCFSCEKLNIENRSVNCAIANSIYENCCKFNVVTPVFECPEYESK